MVQWKFLQVQWNSSGAMEIFIVPEEVSILLHLKCSSIAPEDLKKKSSITPEEASILLHVKSSSIGPKELKKKSPIALEEVSILLHLKNSSIEPEELKKKNSIAPEEEPKNSRKLVPLIKTKSTFVHNFLFFSN